MRVVIDDLVVAGDKVVTRWTASGTHKGPLMGIPPTGKTTAVQGIAVSRLVNGKFVEEWTSWDTLKFMQNLGLVPQLGMGEARTDVREVRPH
jgi:predicted ester cyclase